MMLLVVVTIIVVILFMLMQLSRENEVLKKELLEKNEKVIKLTKKIIKDMMQGKFTIDDIETAKKSFNLALNMALDNEVSLLNNYVFHVFENLPLIEERLDLINKCTKEDIMKVAKKVKINAIYALEGKDEN